MSERDDGKNQRPEQGDPSVPPPGVDQAVASPVRDVEAEFDLKGDGGTSEPPPPRVAPNDADADVTQTYGEITWEQFKKYRIAYGSLWAVIGLVLLAIYAPVVASDLPFVLTIGDTTTWPWLENLFNKGYYENTIDIIFNSLMFLLPLGMLLHWPARRASRGLRKRTAQQVRRRALGLIALLVVLIDGWLIFDPLPGSSMAGFVAQLWFMLFALGMLGVYYASLLIHAAGGMRSERPQRIVAVGALVVAVVAMFGSFGVWSSVRDADNRPESALAQSLGWYKFDFPLPGEAIRQINAERRAAIAETLAAAPSPAQADQARIVELLAEPGFEAVFPPVAYSFRGTSTNIDAAPSAAHPLGTDNIGRDVFARMVFGTRIALTIGIVAVGIYITLGILLGALAGFFGGWVDMVILRFIEIMLCFPTLFLILTLASFVEQASVFYVMLIIGLTSWTGPARLVRGEFLRLRNQEFVQAAKALGLPEWRIIFKHVLPNALGPVLVSATFGVASAILIESTISFLGIGDTDAPTWGKILNDGRVFRNNIMILLPGFAIFLTVSLFNLIGEGLRDALDPKMRR